MVVKKIEEVVRPQRVLASLALLRKRCKAKRPLAAFGRAAPGV